MFFSRRVELPKCDGDVVIVFPGGKTLTVQVRPSNADINYNGSLDIILPEDLSVINWQGDDMTPAPSDGHDNVRLAKQLVMQLPGDYD